MTTTAKIGACKAGPFTGNKQEVNCFMHVYRGEKEIKVVTGPDREFQGRKNRLLHTYEVRGDGSIVPAATWLEQARTSA